MKCSFLLAAISDCTLDKLSGSAFSLAGSQAPWHALNGVWARCRQMMRTWYIETLQSCVFLCFCFLSQTPFRLVFWPSLECFWGWASNFGNWEETWSHKGSCSWYIIPSCLLSCKWAHNQPSECSEGGWEMKMLGCSNTKRIIVCRQETCSVKDPVSQ